MPQSRLSYRQVLWCSITERQTLTPKAHASPAQFTERAAEVSICQNVHKQIEWISRKGERDQVNNSVLRVAHLLNR
jgi:hypothetical protein